MKSVEIFAGIGGLALGLSRVGFQHQCLVEWDHEACQTLKANKSLGIAHTVDWPIFESDVRRFPFALTAAEPTLLSGGVPCQPFSLGGKHLGDRDSRNMFPSFIDLVRLLAPRAILIENVKGLLRPSFSPYFNYILLQLKHPEVTSGRDEEWPDHLTRLEEVETSGTRHGLHYNVVHQLVNAADFGVPQKRERVFIAGLRSDLGLEWSFPAPTHSRDALVYEQDVTGDYWERHSLDPQTPGTATSVEGEPDGMPWVTVRDVVSDLPSFGSPEAEFLSHALWPGARVYPGHTGSPLDAPAKALKVGNHGVPGGENMLVLDDDSVRYMSVREAARVQTFPDEFVFPGSWTQGLQQLGNAVPVELAERIAASLAEVLDGRREAGVEALRRLTDAGGTDDRPTLQSA